MGHAYLAFPNLLCTSSFHYLPFHQNVGRGGEQPMTLPFTKSNLEINLPWHCSAGRGLGFDFSFYCLREGSFVERQTVYRYRDECNESSLLGQIALVTGLIKSVSGSLAQEHPPNCERRDRNQYVLSAPHACTLISLKAFLWVYTERESEKAWMSRWMKVTVQLY